jgi:predicted ATPase/DNA-binding SARP family transcriptional activator
VQIAMLGPLEVHADSGSPVDVGGARLRTLLILLALDAGRVATTQRLIDGVWGEDPPIGAANALQALISRLRRAVPDAPVESHPAGYRLAVEPDAVDVRRFERLVRAGRTALPADPACAAATLSEALALWRGPALADVVGADFARAPAARLTELRLAAIEDRIDAELQLGSGARLVPELEELVTEYPLREQLSGRLIRALCAAGRPAEALAAYERARSALADQLGADPSPALTALYLAVLRGEPRMAASIGDEASRDAAAAEGSFQTNLRTGLTTFVGRDDDVSRVGKLVGESRLTTLIGPGGAGKTRLAVESARTLLGQTPDGVWLVELAPVTDPGDVPQAVLGALGLREQTLLGTRGTTTMSEANDPLTRLVAALADKRMLLVLDNCEHLLQPSAAVVDRLLGECPRIRVLTTSREPLGITGENLWPVEPLAMPSEGATAPEAAGYSSVRLLTDRAAAVRPGFVVDEHNVAAVVRICRALDGMPLAIELAAARLRAMSPEQVASRLTDRFRLLTGGSRTALPRHQTLRAVVDWSWDLLDEAERRLIRRLAVFAGGATLEAAEQVCALLPETAAGPSEVWPASAAGAPAWEVFDLLNALVDKSLLVVTGEDHPRYRMLETIKAYGLERLAEAGELDEVRRAHAAYFLALARMAEPRLRGREQLHWIGRLASDHDNLNVALRAMVAAGDGATAVRLVAALGWYWWLRGHRAEGAELGAEALALPAEVPDAVRAVAYAITALNAAESNRAFEEIRDWFDSATALAASAADAAAPAADGDGQLAAHPILRLIGPVAVLIEMHMSADPSGAEAAGGDRALPLITALFDDADPWLRATTRMMHAHSLINLGRQMDVAESDFEAALEAYQELGERWGIAFSLSAVAERASHRGEHRKAAECYTEAVAQIAELGTLEDQPPLQSRLANELWLLGERDRAWAVLADGRRIADRLGLPEALAAIESGAGELARREGDLDQARVRLTRVASLTVGVNISPQFHALTSSGLGYVETAAGNLDAAREHHSSALEKALSSHDAPVISMTLVGLADLALHTGEPERAAALLGASVRIIGVSSPSHWDMQRVETAARAALSASAFADAVERGRATNADGVRELAALPPAGIVSPRA